MRSFKIRGKDLHSRTGGSGKELGVAERAGWRESEQEKMGRESGNGRERERERRERVFVKEKKTDELPLVAAS